MTSSIRPATTRASPASGNQTSKAIPPPPGSPRRIPGTFARTACNARGRASRIPRRTRRRPGRRVRAFRGGPARSSRSGGPPACPVASQTSEQSRQRRMHWRHVHLLRRAGVGAAEAHARAIHQVVRGIAERLVDVPGDVRVKGDHLADGHGFLLGCDQTLWIGVSVPLEQACRRAYVFALCSGETRS